MKHNSMLSRVLVDTDILELMNSGSITNSDQSLVQPASLDVEIKVGGRIWQVNNDPPLSRGFSFQNYLDSYLLNEFSLERGPVTLTVGSLYLIELGPELTLPEGVWGYANPKSSAGRIDLFCRILCEGSKQYDRVPEGYSGQLYALVYPRTFPVRVSARQSLQQIRFYSGEIPFVSRSELRDLQESENLIISEQDTLFTEDGIVLHLDLETSPTNLVANRTGKVLDTCSRRTEDSGAFFREKPLDHNGCLILDPGDFVLCRSIEHIRIPSNLCMEMQAITTSLGQYSCHAAGFFDPGFGLSSKNGQPGVCEVTNIGSVPIALAHGQQICVMKTQKLFSPPSRLYGQVGREKEASHYTKNSLLAKYFSQ